MLSQKDFAVSPVPPEEKRSLLRVTAVLVAFIVNVATIVVAMRIGNATTPTTAFAGLAIGGFVLSVIGGVTAVIGAHTSLSTGMITTLTFGTKGRNMAAAVLAISLFGWFGVQTEVFASSLGSMLVTLFTLDVPRIVLVVFGGILMSTTAVIGFRALEKLSIVAVPFLVFLLAWPFFLVDVQGILSQSLPPSTMDIATVISITVGGFIAGAVILPDITRYALSKTHALVAATVGFMLMLVLMMGAGAFLGIYAGNDNLVGVLLSLGLGLPALVIVLLATWTTNDSNLYTSSLSLAAIFQNIPKWKLAACAGALGTLLAALGITSFIVPWIILLGLFIAPIGGVLIGDYLTRHRMYEFGHISTLEAARYWPLGCWLAGAAFGWMTTGPTNYGLGLFNFTTVPPLDGLLFSFVLILAVNSLKKN